MSGEYPWVRFFPSDWLAGTGRLTAAEKGVYITLLSAMYDNASPLEENHRRLARLAGCPVSTFKKVLGVLIEEGKIVRTEGGLWNERAQSEIELRQKKSHRAQQSAYERWGKKTKENNEGANADASPQQCERNAIQKPESDTRGNTPPSGSPPTKMNGHDQPELIGEEQVEASEPPERPPDKPKRATSLPSDWQPTSEDINFARQEGMNEQEIDREADRFRDYWLSCGGQRGRKKDWAATWRNWIRKATDDRKRQANGSQPVQGRPKSGGIVASANRLLSEGTQH